jgi:sialidase-1
MTFINRLLLISSLASQLLFIILFLQHNEPGLTNFVLIVIVAVSYATIFSLISIKSIKNKPIECKLKSKMMIVFVCLLTASAIIYITLDNLVFSYFQPITTSDPIIFAWLTSWSAILVHLLLNIFSINNKYEYRLTHALNMSLVALFGLPIMMLVSVITDPQPNPKISLSKDIFIGGTDGYKVYRIPSLIVLPKGSTLKTGHQLKEDRIIAMAEARRDGALDTGVIDLVQKISDDGGNSWSKQQVICQYIEQDMQGKCGNATPVFDSVTGIVFLAYNLSGIPINAPEGSRAHKSFIMTSDDGGLHWNDGIELSIPNSVFGPGHGIQKSFAPFKNRLVIPYNTSVGGQGSSMALLSDDNGETWVQGQHLGTGNENEIAELSDGSLIMATRHIAPVGNPPTPNGRLFSISKNGGANWERPYLDQTVPTPICQASILTTNDQQGLLFLNPADISARVQLTLRYSSDDGKSWGNSLVIYPGPSGYSQLGILSNNNIIALYENGTLSYSQKISLVSLQTKIFLK